MDVDCTTTKRRRFANASEDRLSSLHDDVLIRIISHLPFPYVVVTECLSSRWSGLWTHLTSININRLECKTSRKFITNIRHLLSRITSPCIDTFSVELDCVSNFSVQRLLPSIDSWIESLTNNHKTVRELKVRRLSRILGTSMPVLQKFILQTQTSLVSLELIKLIKRQSLPNVDFNLPNLRNLKLEFYFLKDSEWLNKLIKGCPLLENLDLSCQECIGSSIYVIHAPKLKYLSIHGNHSSIFCFSEIPIAPRHVRVRVLNFFGQLSDEESKMWSTFYKGVSNATVLHLNVLPTLQLSSTVFRRASQLTLDINIPFNVQTVLSFLELCPVINFLTLRIYSTYGDKEESEPPKPFTLQSALQRIHVEIYHDPYYSKRCFKVVEYLLTNTINLAHFEFDLTNSINWSSDSVKAQQRRELELYKRLYKCPAASTACEVKFVGKFYKRFQKAGPKAWIES